MQHAYRSPGRPELPSRPLALDGVLGLDGRGATVWIFAGIAVFIHLLLPWIVRFVTILMALVGLLFAKILPDHQAKAPPVTFEVEVEAPPVKELPKEEPKEEPKPEVKEAPKDLKVEPQKEAPVAAAAAAGAVLTQETKPDEPVDLTNSFVTGSGTAYAGGTTMAAGTATQAVRAPVASPTGVVGGTGTGAPAPVQTGPDRSRSAGLGGSKSWNDCPFPPEADVDNIDQAAVLVQVSVAPDGRPATVKIVSDPGHGFGRAARSCAMQRSYQTALDREGKPVGGIFTANVTFAR